MTWHPFLWRGGAGAGLLGAACDVETEAANHDRLTIVITVELYERIR